VRTAWLFLDGPAGPMDGSRRAAEPPDSLRSDGGWAPEQGEKKPLPAVHGEERPWEDVADPHADAPAAGLKCPQGLAASVWDAVRPRGACSGDREALPVASPIRSILDGRSDATRFGGFRNQEKFSFCENQVEPPGTNPLADPTADRGIEPRGGENRSSGGVRSEKFSRQDV